jgi:hypothetical protein
MADEDAWKEFLRALTQVGLDRSAIHTLKVRHTSAIQTAPTDRTQPRTDTQSQMNKHHYNITTTGTE